MKAVNPPGAAWPGVSMGTLARGSVLVGVVAPYDPRIRIEAEMIAVAP